MRGWHSPWAIRRAGLFPPGRDGGRAGGRRGRDRSTLAGRRGSGCSRRRLASPARGSRAGRPGGDLHAAGQGERDGAPRFIAVIVVPSSTTWTGPSVGGTSAG